MNGKTILVKPFDVCVMVAFVGYRPSTGRTTTNVRRKVTNVNAPSQDFNPGIKVDFNPGNKAPTFASRE
jgi:hypothetical protein